MVMSFHNGVEWRPVVGYESRYEVSADGRVRSFTREETAYRGPTRYRRTRFGRELAFHHTRGYRSVSLSMNGRQKWHSVHRLVAFAFIGPSDLQIRHLDGDKTNNVPSNLAWGTAKENADDREAHGHTKRGSAHPMVKRTEEQVREIKRLAAAGMGSAAIGRAVGLNRSRVHEIMRGRQWRHI